MSPAVIADVDDLAPEAALPLTVAGPEGPLTLVLARTEDGVMAYLDSCPHLGASLQTAEGKVLRKRDHIFCAHHAAAFEAATGACIWGPCLGRGLTPVPVIIAEGKIWLG